MDEQANIVAQAQTNSEELRRDSISENMRRGSRLVIIMIFESEEFI